MPQAYMINMAFQFFSNDELVFGSDLGACRVFEIIRNNCTYMSIGNGPLSIATWFQLRSLKVCALSFI